MSTITDEDRQLYSRVIAGESTLTEDRGVIEVVGPDATSFLQGQVAQDLDSVEDKSAKWSFVLEPNGKTPILSRVWKLSSSNWALDVDSEVVEALVTRLNTFRFRVNCEVKDSSLLVVRSSGIVPSGVAAAVGVTQQPSNYPAYLSAEAAAESPAVYETFRVTEGQPRANKELDEKTIPQETGWTDIAVSFTKGCFTGQELVARLDSRGRVNRELRRLEFPSGTTVSEGAELRVGDEIAGEVTSVAPTLTENEGLLGLGYIKRQFLETDEVIAAQDTDMTRISPLPLLS